MADAATYYPTFWKEWFLMTNETMAARALILADARFDELGFNNWALLCSVIHEFIDHHCNIERFQMVYNALAMRKIQIG